MLENRVHVHLLTILACILLSTAILAAPKPDANTKRKLPATKAAIAPDIDGDITDPVWRTAAAAETFVDSQNGTRTPDQTSARLLYDARFIYVAFYCKDSKPDGIVARETVRDSKYQLQNSGNGPGDTEDNVEVSFDCFSSHQWTDQSRFSVNALGTPSAAVAGGSANKQEWVGDWTAAAKRVTDGWSAEMRIPWAALNYPASNQPITMGINFTRFQVRTQIQSIWSNTGPQGFLEMEGQWTGVEVPQTAFHSALSLLPYTLTTNRSATPVFRGGLDARYAVTPQLTAVGSVNPDFSTIENALASIQFTRGQPYVPETRPFFLEGGNNFFPANINLIGSYLYTENIPAFDFGTKLFGKVTPQDTVGVLDTLSSGARNDFVARYRHDMSATSSLSAFVVQKSEAGADNSLGLLVQDARWGKLASDVQLALTGGQQAAGDSEQFIVTYADKLDYLGIGIGQVSPYFRDADGQIPFTGYYGVFPFATWGAQWRQGFWRGFNASLFPNVQWHTDGRPFQRGGNLDVNFTARQDWTVDLTTLYNAFDSTSDNTYALTLTNGVSNRFRQYGLQVLVGREANRPAMFFGPVFSFRVLRRLDLGYNGAVQSLDGVTQQHILTLNYQLTPTRAFGGRLVMQNGQTNLYCFFRQAGGRGLDYYVILGDPNAPTFAKRLTIKFVYPI